MSNTKKTAELLKTECSQCGNCCRDPFIELTHHDIKRLVKHTKLTADKLVTLYGPSDLDSKDEHEWVHLSYGKRLIGLPKKRNGNCMFLSDDNSCGAYEARPMACHLFPLDPIINNDVRLESVELSNVIKDGFIECSRSKGKGRSFENYSATASMAQKEYESYCNKVDKWNDLPVKGNKNEFLTFLGCRVKK
jgi:Fe-S-cluster containining protein